MSVSYINIPFGKPLHTTNRLFPFLLNLFTIGTFILHYSTIVSRGANQNRPFTYLFKPYFMLTFTIKAFKFKSLNSDGTNCYEWAKVRYTLLSMKNTIYIWIRKLTWIWQIVMINFLME